MSPALIDAVVDALVADTLAAPVVEPAVAGGAHTGAGGLALVPAHALRHVGHRAVHRHRAHLARHLARHLVPWPGHLALAQRVLAGGQEGGHVDVHGEGDHGPAPLRVILVCQGLEQGGAVLLQILQ